MQASIKPDQINAKMQKTGYIILDIAKVTTEINLFHPHNVNNFPEFLFEFKYVAKSKYLL